MSRTMRSRGVSSYRTKKRSKRRGNKLSRRLSKRRVKRSYKRSNRRLNKKNFKRVSKRMRNNRKSFRRRGGAKTLDYSIKVEGHESKRDSKLKWGKQESYIEYKIVLYKGKDIKATVMRRWSEIVKLDRDIKSLEKQMPLRRNQKFTGVIVAPFFKKNSEEEIKKRKEDLKLYFEELAIFINNIRRSSELRRLFRSEMESETEIDLIEGATYIDPNNAIKNFFTEDPERYAEAERIERLLEQAEQARLTAQENKGAIELESV